jgi:hypothetical protein
VPLSFQSNGQRSINLTRQCFRFRPTATALSGDTSKPHRTDFHTWCNSARRLRSHPRSRHPVTRRRMEIAGYGRALSASAATAGSCPYHTARIQKSEPADSRDREDTGRIRDASDGCIPGISVSSSGTFLKLAHPLVTSGALECSFRFPAHFVFDEVAVLPSSDAEARSPVEIVRCHRFRANISIRRGLGAMRLLERTRCTHLLRARPNSLMRKLAIGLASPRVNWAISPARHAAGHRDRPAQFGVGTATFRYVARSALDCGGAATMGPSVSAVSVSVHGVVPAGCRRSGRQAGGCTSRDGGMLPSCAASSG